MSPYNRSQLQQRGSALVEMAMVLPLLALLLIGVVNMGLLIREHQILQNAAREGARFSSWAENQLDMAANPTAVEDAIKTQVQTYLARENITLPDGLSDVTVNQNYTYTVTCPSCAGGTMTVKASQVTVSYSRSMLMGPGWLWPFGPVTLTGQSVFRNLGP